MPSPVTYLLLLFIWGLLNRKSHIKDRIPSYTFKGIVYDFFFPHIHFEKRNDERDSYTIMNIIAIKLHIAIPHWL